MRAVTFLAPTTWEQRVAEGRIHKHSWFAPDALYADRVAYWNDDVVGQFLLRFLAKDVIWQGKSVQLDVLDAAGNVVVGETLPPLRQPKAALLLAVSALKPGHYTLRATLPGEKPTVVTTTFERANKSSPRVALPRGGIAIELDPTSAVTDGAWPVTAGIPFPRGTVTDLSRLELVEDGKPVPAQLEPVGTWSPEAGGVRSPVRWARLSFIGRYRTGAPAQYRLRWRVAPASRGAAPAASIHVDDMSGMITVDNGVVRFQVDRRSFRGVQSAWFDANGDGVYSDDEHVVAGKSGAYVVDADGVVYEAAADKAPVVTVEESGPVRVVIAAEGWYVRADDGDQKLCRFVTRIIAYAGDPSIRVEQGTVITFDTDKQKLADIGLRIPVSVPQAWRLGVDGAVHDGDVPPRGSVFLHQFRWDKLRVVGTRPGEDVNDAGAGEQGRKSDGWFTLTSKGSAAAVSVFVRDIWQKFPKEVEIDRSGFTVHFWPKHGVETFSRGEMLDPKNIYKLWWTDQGKLLDLAFPDDAYRALKALDERTHWDPETTTEQARTSNGQGVVIGNRYVLRFHRADVGDEAAEAALAQQDPHARAGGAWTTATKVEGDIAPYDPRRFPALEADLDTFWPDYMKNVVEAGAEYGMFIYADVHDNEEPNGPQADLHRVWSASHYRNVSTPWLLYLRGDSPENLRFAAANTDHFMDVDTVNYAVEVPDPEHPGEARPEFRWHRLGAMYHAKGFVPWGGSAYGDASKDGYSGVFGHWINPDAYRYRFLVEGNHRAWDLYRTWGDAMKSTGLAPGGSRENINTYGEELAYYEATWDPDFIPFLRDEEEMLMARPLAKLPVSYDHPGWHRFWHSRAFELLRDPRIVKSVTDYCRGFGKKKPAMLAWAFEQTGDKSFLEAALPSVYDASKTVYRDDDDARSGVRARNSAYATFYYQEMPYFMQALKQAGFAHLIPGPDERWSYPSHRTHWDFTSEKSPAVRVMYLKPRDRDVHLHFATVPGYDTYHPAFRVRGPDDDVVLEQDKPKPGSGRFIEDAVVPKDGRTGLYSVDLRAPDGTKLLAPLTDAPVEGTLLDRDEPYAVFGRSDVYLVPLGKAAKVELTFHEEQTTPLRTFVGYVRVEDARGRKLLEATLLAGGHRDSATVSLDTTTMPAPYHLYQVGGFGPRWTGTATAIVAAPTAQQARTLERALAHAPHS